MKFKVGDKVKILPYATSVNVESEDVGKIGVITSTQSTPSRTYGIIVYMDEICNARGCKCKWSVGTDMIKLSSTKGKQLLFDFMN